MKNKLLLKIALGFLPICIYSQNYVGFNTDNYNGVHGVLSNPANATDSRTKFDLNLISLSSHATNDYGSVNFTDLINDDFDFEDENRTLRDNNNGAFNLDVLGPSVLFNINAKNSIAITTRARAFFNLNNIKGSAVDLFDEGIDGTDPISVENISLNGTAHVWGEIGVTYARVLLDQGVHFVKGGLTAKYLEGAGYATVQSENLSLNYEPLVPTLTGIDGEFEVDGNVEYSFSDNLDKNGNNEILDSDDDYNEKTASTGFGFDLGFVYEYRPNYEEYTRVDKNGNTVPLKNKNKYLVKVGASVTDIGRLKYKDSPTTLYNFNGVVLNENTVTDADIETIDNILDNTIDGGRDTGSRNRKIKLPAAAHLNIDWNAYKKLYLNLNGDLSLIKKDKENANRIANAITATPRLETKFISIYSPLGIREYGGFIWGAGLRVGPLFVGSGSVLSNLIDNKSTTADLYLGLKIPIYQKRLKDKDGDGVIDKEDECPKEAGPASNNGCPEPVVEKAPVKKEIVVDSDNDGIIDSLDRCPNKFGIAANNGCPEIKIVDTDNDGVPDNKDKCPNEFGLMANSGCPSIPELRANSEEAKAVEKTINTYAKTINFNSGKTSFTNETYTALESVLKILNKYSTSNFIIAGYTDSVGSTTSNQQLSERRALSVKTYFITKGITASRLEAKGYGEENPIATNGTSEGRSKNRRVEIKLN